MLVLVILRVPHLQAQPALERDTAAVSEESLAAIVEPLVQMQLRTQRIAGAVVVAVSAGEVVYRRGFGLADVNRQRIMQTDTPVRLASISKTTPR
jgi:CubicO group peptidase (beta-lactamase class C family)